MIQSTKPKLSRRIKYPNFVVTGLVDVFEHGDLRPIITVKASCFISNKDEAYRLMMCDAKRRLMLACATNERIESLFFEGVEIINLTACDAKGVRRCYGDRIEAFFDSPELPKRDVLIRQRRLVPYDHADMLAIYGSNDATATAQGGSA